MITDFPAYFNKLYSTKKAEDTEAKKDKETLLNECIHQCKKLLKKKQDSSTVESEVLEVTEITHKSTSELRGLNGKLVKLACKISDVLDVEMYTGFAELKEDGSEVPIFFNDQNVGLVKEEGKIARIVDDALFDRNVSFLRPISKPFEKLEEFVLSEDLVSCNAQELEDKEKSGLKFPILAKYYDTRQIPKLDCHIVVYGVLSMSSKPIQKKPEELDPNNVDLQYCTDDYYVPVLHVLAVEDLNILEEITQEDNLPIQSQKLEMLTEFRDTIIRGFRGDQTSADTFLACLFSKVQRKDLQIIDLICANFFGFEQDSKEKEFISFVASTLMPFSLKSDLDLKLLSRQRFYSKKNYKTNVLEPGSINLQNSMLWILDETNIASGVLTEYGVKNAKFINDVVEFQKCYYDFEFSQFSSLVELKVASFSQTRSIFKFAHKVHFQPQTDPEELEKVIGDFKAKFVGEYLKKAKEVVIELCRVYPLIDFTEETSKKFQEDFIAERKSKQEKYTLDMFQDSINFGKVYAALRGADKMEIEDYLKAKQLVAEITKRAQDYEEKVMEKAKKAQEEQEKLKNETIQEDQGGEDQEEQEEGVIELEIEDD